MYEIKRSGIQGKGVFAIRNVKKNEHLFHIDLDLLPSYSLKEIDKDPKLKANGDHSDYVGNGRYAIDLSPSSYMNHSCNPNCYVRMKTITIKDVYALKDIKKGEELTLDYTLTSVDQFAGMGFWSMDCKCGSENCRGLVVGDFFTLPKEKQSKFYRNLPPSIIKKYASRFKEHYS
ncbi:MAG: SET domain-containing protein-lysine N-methyltransferase [Candidatus Lokiarchaeota archaeon]|nr:SET domain-containing protein-lysine N-methyltransferase [Candidatus Lokiarchaeota archaeon]